ncbi:serine/threonine-protein kinase [Sorangium cellulosum]|uniref:serine/threonine-protein kinase n=1 Tax=Sorangium cellulosum TaxID=56 RepID=UPI0005D2A118|nr:serine/threonine-protein kinase [Sorangium cellulosum]
MSSLAEGSVIAGRYRLERMLARGGMGAIWVARHVQLDAAVAIKLMAPEYAASSTARARFEREARAAAQLKIPNVVHVHDYGIEGETPFLVMELLDGEDLETRLAREGRLSLSATLSVVAQVCKALRRAHEMGIIHRDLKPANLFLARQDDEEIVKVLDFGIAKAQGALLAGKETKTGTLVGSPYYMSPEQVRRSKTLDWRSDLWSVGVIAYRCVTGRLPFPGEEIGEVFVAICTEDVPLASSLAPELGPEVDRFFSRAFMREPERRFQSASELAEALSAAAAAPGAETGAPRPPAPVGASPGAIGASAGAMGAPPGLLRSEPNADSDGAFRSTLPAAPADLPRGAPGSGANQGGAPAFQETASTLAPSGSILVVPPGSGRRGWIPLAFGASVLALGLVTYAVLRATAPSDAPASRPDPAGSPASAAAQPATPLSAAEPSAAATEPSAAATEPSPPAAPSASAAASASSTPAASTSASAPAPPSPAPRRGTPQPARPRTAPDDPTDHM